MALLQGFSKKFVRVVAPAMVPVMVLEVTL